MRKTPPNSFSSEGVEMATYREIAEFVRSKYGKTVETCWIAHVKDLNGLKPRRAPNRKSDKRVKPCPDDKREMIEHAMRHFGMIK